MPIIAYATTGQRGLDRLPSQEHQRKQQLKQFISAVYECALEKSIDSEMNQFYAEKNAIGAQKFDLLLSLCTGLYPVRWSYREIDELESSIQLDLGELTQILRRLKESKDAYYTISVAFRDEIKKYFSELASQQQWTLTDMSDNSYSQFHAASQLLNTYNQYFIDALNRLEQYNQPSNYAIWLMICVNADKYGFSYENKGRLLRITSLIPFKLETLLQDIPALIAYFKQLEAFQAKNGAPALDALLSAQSNLVPCSSQSLTIEKLSTFLSNEAMHKSIELYFQDFRVDNYLDEVRDVDFYASSAELDQPFPGLGKFYVTIKAILLQRYPVTWGENKIEAWKLFLSIIHQLKTSEEQYQALQTVLQATHSQIDLTTLNNWLRILLNQSDCRLTFQPDYFNLLSHELMKHDAQPAFTAILDKWSSYPGNLFSVASHKGFIAVLNKIATIDRGFLCLQNLADACCSIGYIGDEQQHPWYDDVIKLIHLWQRQSGVIESLNVILASLHKLKMIASEQKQNGPQFRQLILRWLANIEQTYTLTQHLAEHWDAGFPQQSFHILQILGQVTEDLPNMYQALLRVNQEQLLQIAACYQLKPVPAPHLLKQLMTGKISLADFIAEHTRDPHQERNAAKLKQQFDNDILWPYLNRAKQLKHQASTPLDFSDQLNAQLKFVNHLGKQFRHLSLSDIQKRLHECRAQLSKATDKDDILVLQLTALSLIREAVYKTSQVPVLLWPSAVQMLAILSALNHQRRQGASPLFSQLATGEGKSLIAVFRSILMWVHGGGVAIVTHRASLAFRDAQAYTALFTALDIECKHLTADSYRRDFYWRQLIARASDKPKKPEFDDIYFVEFNDLALIRQQRLLDVGIDITNMSFIVDEGDEIILHNQTDNNLTQKSDAEDTHPYAWVFEALAAYLEQFSNPKKLVSVRLSDLVDYLHLANPIAARTCQKIEFLQKLPIYLQAAWQARTLVEKDDFIVKPKVPNGNEYYAAVILNDKYMPPNVTFKGLIHQALHGRLNHQAKQLQLPHTFSIAAETQLFSTMSPEAVLHWMKSCGTVNALSATIGSNAERLEMEQNFGFDYFKLPRMQALARVDYPERFCLDEKQQMQAIAEICQHYTGDRTPSKSRAIIIPVDSIEFAEHLNQYLKNHSKQFTPRLLHAGLEDVSDQTLSELELASGKSGHILIAVGGLVSRGFDAKLSTAKQVVVIITYLKNAVDAEQIKGRTSRVNPTTGLRDKGKCYAVYNLAKECQRYPALKVKTDDIAINSELFKQRQYFAHYQQESALRLHRQLAGVSKNIIQENFFDLWKPLFKNSHVSREMRDEIMVLFTHVLEKIDSMVLSQNALPERLNYNTSIIASYEAAVVSIQSVLGDVFRLDVKTIMSSLSNAMQEQQNRLIHHHQQAIAAGFDQPRIKVYKQWKQGVKLNAYLDSGKQSLGNYMLSLFNTWQISAENNTKLQQEKITLEKEIARKNHKKMDFLSQLKQMMSSVNKQEDLFERLLRLNKKMQDLPDREEKNVSLLCHATGTEVSVTHDPFLGMANQISVRSHHFLVFEKLQHAINQVYAACQIQTQLDYRITVLDKKEPCLLHVVIDFSGHQFDSIPRTKIMTMLAKEFGLVFVNRASLPSLIAMQTIIAELKDKLLTTDIHLPHYLNANFLSAGLTFSRQNFYDLIFKPTIALLKEHKHQLNPDMQHCMHALASYHQALCYRDQAGRQYQADAPIFENLSTLLENHKKRSALYCINTQIKVLQASSFNKILLLRQQLEYLIQLGMGISHANSSESLQVIYEKWKKTAIQYRQHTMTIHDVMRFRQQQPTLFSNSRSPDADIICQQIDGMLAPTQLRRLNY